MKPMSLRQFGKVVRRVMETLPDELKEHLDNVVVDVVDDPDEALLRSAGLSEEEIAGGETLYGLFDPVALPSGYDTELHRIWIFKRPLEEDFPERAELLNEVRKTVFHELAHHFGYSDRDLERWTSVY
jgi:predicted Zn-dependent protease with MMP-like domain